MGLSIGCTDFSMTMTLPGVVNAFAPGALAHVSSDGIAYRPFTRRGEGSLSMPLVGTVTFEIGSIVSYLFSETEGRMADRDGYRATNGEVWRASLLAAS
jgi:hypothetical protein